MLHYLKRLDEALASHERTIALKPDHAEAYNNRGIVLFELGRLDEALASYARAIALKPNYAEAHSNRGACLFDLGRLDEALASCEKAVALKPDHAQAHSNRGKILYLLKRGDEALASFGKAVALNPDLAEVWFERSNVFYDDQVANVVRSSEVDILVDLIGFTGGARTGIFGRRPAPVQVNYLGYAGTMGTPHIDYVLADRFVIPEGKRTSYSEKVVYLPNSYMPTDSLLKISDRSPRRSEHGLPEAGFVFCSFNNVYKITPEIFGVWMRLLRAIDGSVFWLSETNETATRNLRYRAQSLGIDPARLKRDGVDGVPRE